MHGNFAAPAAESSADAGELLLRFLSCSLPDAIYFKDLRRRYLFLNAAECRRLGVSTPQDVIGRTADQLVSAKRARLWRQEETEIFVTGEPLIDRVEEVERGDGVVRWLSSTKVPVRNAEGNVTGLVGITRDITHHKVAEQLKERFVSTISHEMRTPVTSIMGALGLVVSGAAGPVPQPAGRLLQIAHTNGQRLLHLLSDILDVDRIQSGMMVFDLKQVDIRPVVEREVVSIRSYAEPLGVSVRLEPRSASGRVLADPERLAQAVSNLLSNAVKHSPCGQEVVVSIERRPQAIKICVRDHGPGVPEAFRKRIFDRFVQVGTCQARPKSGTGLGLAIVKEIAEHMKGEVGFSPAQGGGSVFWMVLPRCEAGAALRTEVATVGGVDQVL